MPYNFGLEGYTGIVLYATMWVAFYLSIFKDPVYGLYYLAPLLPVQTVRYRLNEHPFGGSVLTIIMIGMAIGLWKRGESPIPKTPWTVFLVCYGIFTFASLCQGSLYLNEPLSSLFSDPRFSEWRDYVTMIALLFFTAATVKTKSSIQILITIMCVSGFLLNKSFWGTVSGRDFSAYSDDLRDEGGMGYAGVNGLAAFEAQFGCLMLVLASFDKRKLYKLAYYALGVFSVVCLMYSLSRAGYAAAAVGLIFVSVFKNRVLLVAMVVFGLTWTAVVPNAVRERVVMTSGSSGELDHSSETRVTLWEDAMNVFAANPVVGSGFLTYAYMQRVGNYKDTHNIYLKVLVETGIVGFLLFLFLLGSLWFQGMQLWSRAVDPLYGAIGFGLASWVVCAAVANFFGDRWTFLQVNGFMWILAGLAARAIVLNKEAVAELYAPQAELEVEQEMVTA